MQKIRLEITGIAYSQTQSGSYVLTLSESAGKRKLPIVIGGFEAQSIAVELEKMVPNRPLTHDLIKMLCKSYSISVKEILIYKFFEGVFYAKIICEKDGVLTEIDSRTSDAIAVGVRFNAPIFALSEVVEEAGGVDDGSEDYDDEVELNDSEESSGEMEHLNEEELQNMLSDAIENEDYELASKIRDALKNRN
jgi:bifunctional DNase/RNase